MGLVSLFRRDICLFPCRDNEVAESPHIRLLPAVAAAATAGDVKAVHATGSAGVRRGMPSRNIHSVGGPARARRTVLPRSGSRGSDRGPELAWAAARKRGGAHGKARLYEDKTLAVTKTDARRACYPPEL